MRLTHPASTTQRGRSPLSTTGPEKVVVDLGALGFERGGYLLVDRAVRQVRPGAVVALRGADDNLEMLLQAWGRSQGHKVSGRDLTVGRAAAVRWQGAERAGGPESTGTVAEAPLTWGLAARGALVEEGGPAMVTADLRARSEVWADAAPRLYALAAAGQWDPATAVDWSAPTPLPLDIERAVAQIMTYLVENEQVALVVSARFIGRIHPHYREVLQFLATQAADEARHIEVFTRRALLNEGKLGSSSVGGRASLQTLLTESEFSLSSFLLSVMGEGTFLHLLSFLERHAPDPLTSELCRLVLQDEARHVAFGLSHLESQLNDDPDLRPRLWAAATRRHEVLQSTAGLNADVSDALVLLAAGSWDPTAIGAGWDAVQELQAEMEIGRRRRLSRLGFSADEAADLAALHTRNFM